jgi:hypothetical protein
MKVESILIKWFIEGECRTQTTLMAESLDDYVSETNPVRVVDVFVDELDLFVSNQRLPVGHRTIPQFF